jgi:hypothetical protein
LVVHRRLNLEPIRSRLASHPAVSYLAVSADCTSNWVKFSCLDKILRRTNDTTTNYQTKTGDSSSTVETSILKHKCIIPVDPSTRHGFKLAKYRLLVSAGANISSQSSTIVHGYPKRSNYTASIFLLALPEPESASPCLAIPPRRYQVD